MLNRCFFFFFKQKTAYEILTVTGVQTCALPIYVAREVGGEKEHGRGHVCGLAQAPEGDSVDEALPRLRRDALGQLRLHEAGGDRIDEHVAGGQLLGHRLGEADQARLGGGVVRLARVAPQPHDARNVDDATVAPLDHATRHVLRHQEGALQVRVQNGVPVLVRDAEHQVVAGRARDNLVLRISDEDWNAVLDTNLKGAFLMTKHVARGMIKRRHGRIVNITSVVGLWGNAGQANYAASKAGLVGFTKSVAKELASRNVLVNAIAPGFVETELTKGITAEARQGFIDAIPLRRLGEAADVASAVLFLASDFASYITGQVLVVDGGLVL